jgi:hypothetical protein
MDEHGRAPKANPTLQILRGGILAVLFIVAAIIAAHYIYDFAVFR